MLKERMRGDLLFSRTSASYLNTAVATGDHLACIYETDKGFAFETSEEAVLKIEGNAAG